MRAIYFDSSILRALPFRGIADVLGPIIKLRDDLTVDLWTVDVCVREIVGYHTRSSREALAKLRSAFSNTRLYHRDRSELLEPGMMSESDIHAHVTAELAAARIGVVPTATVDVNELVDMAIARRPPFDDQGRGFRDALILESVTKHAAANYSGDDVLLAAADKDFAVSELKARSDRCGVRISKVQSIDRIPATAYGLRREAVDSWFGEVARVAIELFKRDRVRYEADVRDLLQPSETFLLKGGRYASPDDRPAGDPLFLSFSRLHRIEGIRFGNLSPGDWSDTVAVERTEGRIYASIEAEVEFDLLLSRPQLSNAFASRKFSLPTNDSPGSVQEPTYAEQTDAIETIKRKVPIVVSMQDEGEHLTDLKIEQCMV